MRLMNIAGLRAKKRKISLKKNNINVYPYLLNDMDINRPNLVWIRWIQISVKHNTRSNGKVWKT